MLEYGIPDGVTSMAKTVGVPCGIAVQLILDGTFLIRSYYDSDLAANVRVGFQARLPALVSLLPCPRTFTSRSWPTWRRRGSSASRRLSTTLPRRETIIGAT